VAALALLVAHLGGHAVPGGQVPSGLPGHQLFLEAPGAVLPPARTAGPAVMRSRAVRINWGVLGLQDGSTPRSARDPIELNLFPDAIYTAVAIQVERQPSGSVTWVGRLEGVTEGRVTLVVNDGVIVGRITVPGRFFQVRHAGDGVHVVQEVDQAQFPPESPPIPR
jgi:hypothetical protein